MYAIIKQRFRCYFAEPSKMSYQLFVNGNIHLKGESKMKVKFLTLTLLSQLAIAAIPTSTFAAAVTAPVLVEADMAFLRQKITYQFNFPTDARDQIINEAARFLNQEKFTSSTTYQDLLDDLIKEDEYFSTEHKENKNPLIPGAFLDAASDLYREAADVISADDFEIGTVREREDRAAEEKANFIKFADILEKQGRIIAAKPIDVKQSLASLKIQLDNAIKSGKKYKKVYIYSDAEYYHDDYRRLMLDYPGIEIVFRLFPDDVSIFFTESGYIDDGLIFIEHLPIYYPAYYDPIWYPYYDHYISISPFFLSFAYPYNVWGYWYGYYGRHGSDYWDGWRHDRWRDHRFGDRDWHESWEKRRHFPRDHDRERAALTREGIQPRGYHLNREMTKDSGDITKIDSTQRTLTDKVTSGLTTTPKEQKIGKAEKRGRDIAAEDKSARDQKRIERAEKRGRDIAIDGKSARDQRRIERAERKGRDVAIEDRSDRDQRRIEKAERKGRDAAIEDRSGRDQRRIERGQAGQRNIEKQAKREEPRVRAEQPRVRAEQPKVRAEQPKVRAEQPRARAEQPRARVEQPRVRVEQPRARVEQPRVRVEQPRVQMERPKISSPAPRAQAPQAVGPSGKERGKGK